MDMDMDVAWCLTCSKRTRDSRSPYCSEACREADIRPSTPSAAIVAITSPVPPIMTSPSPRVASLKSTSPVKKHAKRPSVAPLVPVPSSSEVSSPLSPPKPLPRDRRAFSFPATQSPAPPVMIKDRKSRKSSNVLPPFVRKPSVIATPMTSPPMAYDVLPAPVNLPLALGAAKATGGNTPIFADSVFCSTSESSENEGDKLPVKPLAAIAVASRPLTSAVTSQAATLPEHRHFSTLRSQLSRGRPSAQLRTRETSHSPVAAMVASSASSRSREDIISWAKAVGMRPDVDADSDEEYHRGRSRTRRRETLAHLPPPSTEPLDEHDDSTGPGTTPKGRIGYALAGLGMSGIAPIVKALTSVAAAPAKPTKPSTTGLGLQSVPAPAEISRVAVVATTLPGEDAHDGPPAHFFGGATPTLSTISFSEVVDPSVGDNHDPVDIVTDDQSAASSGFARRASAPFKLSYSSSTAPQVRERRLRNSLPLRPISTTASAIWNLSAYLRSFAPFSIGSVIAPYAPFAAMEPTEPTPDSSTPSLVRSTPAQPAAPAPMPAFRPDSPVEETSPQDMVRSLPMNIIVPPTATGILDGRRKQSVSSRRSRSGSRSIAPTRSPSPVRGRSRSRGSINRSRSSSAGIQVAQVDLGRNWSLRADDQTGIEGERTRGRSRVGKALGTLKDRGVSVYQDEEERCRGRGRERGREEGRVSDSRGRGRDRGVRAA